MLVQDGLITKSPVAVDDKNYIFLTNVEIGTAFYFDYLAQRKEGRDLVVADVATDLDGTIIENAVAIYITQIDYSLIAMEMLCHYEQQENKSN